MGSHGINLIAVFKKEAHLALKELVHRVATKIPIVFITHYGKSIYRGHSIKLAPNDTVILGSDGLFDNFTIPEICEKTKDLSLDELAAFIYDEARRRMSLASDDGSFKADDMSFIVFKQN